MKDNANLEDVLSALRDKNSNYFDFGMTDKDFVILYNELRFDWQLNKPFSEQSDETKTTLNKIL